MPCGAGREAPLRLTAGADRHLALLTRSVACLALAAWLIASAAAAVKAAGIALLAVTWVALERLEARPQPTRLLLLPDGRCSLGDSAGRLGRHYWISRRYCVVTCETTRGARRVLIARSRQTESEYRKLLGWLRLRIRTDS